MSLLLIGGTGGGKTVTQSALIAILMQKCPGVEFWVISQKNDSFQNLDKKKRVTIFDIDYPGESLSVIDHVWRIYDQRRKLPRNERANLSPVRLLLADWLSINSALEKCASHPEIKESNYLIKLADIVFNGRDFNVCLWADLQSFNLKAIGMKADSNSRRNFNLIGLGNFYKDEYDCVNESYGVLSNMIGNRFMVEDSDERASLMKTFNQLKPISKANQRPIMFSTLEPASVVLQADIRHYMDEEIQSKIEIIPTTPYEAWDEDSTYTLQELTKEGASKLIAEMKKSLNQGQIIEQLWGAIKGSSKAYQKALVEYKFLTGDGEI